MTLRQITISIAETDLEAVAGCARESGALGVQIFGEASQPARATVSLISDGENRQELLDALQFILAGKDDWRISILPIETTIPFHRADEEEVPSDVEPENGGRIAGLTREEIFNGAWSNARIDRNFLVFVLLSGVVATFGMIEDNVAVVIGAMVIAPLLGPVLAFSVAVALGDEKLMLRAAAAVSVGVGLAVLLGFAISLIWPIEPGSDELQARTELGFDGIAIALASGAAAALSLVTGLSSALVGVMVAVALLPPATASGVFLGAGEMSDAFDAFLLLLLNVVCVNVAAQTVMFTRGITPRTWFERRKARRGSLINAAVWVGLLLALAALLILRTPEI